MLIVGGYTDIPLNFPIDEVFLYRIEGYIHVEVRQYKYGQERY